MAVASNLGTKKDPGVRCQGQALVGLTGHIVQPRKVKRNVVCSDYILSIFCLVLRRHETLFCYCSTTGLRHEYMAGLRPTMFNSA